MKNIIIFPVIVLLVLGLVLILSVLNFVKKYQVTPVETVSAIMENSL